MKIIHTSDWHLGRYLNKTKKRYDEFEAFLGWLAETIDQRQANALIVAGDIFDNTTPTHKAQELYYNFLRRAIVSCPSCRHVVIVGGNHDSPSFLEAPARLLKGLGVHVLGAMASDIRKELLALKDQNGQLELIVLAVPFLRESDLRLAELGESDDGRHQKIVMGLAAHYKRLAELARETIEENGKPVPVLATGHLFLQGSVTAADDGVREIHAGPLAALPLSTLPKFDYLALGHIHGAQRVGKDDSARYSGSPIPMGFNEASRAKSVCIVEFEGLTPKVEMIEVPMFQPLKRIEGDIASLLKQITALKGTGTWLEVAHTGNLLTGEHRRQLDEALAASGLEMLTLRDSSPQSLTMSEEAEIVSLSELSLEAIFDRLLKDSEVDEAEWPELRAAHGQLAEEIAAGDVLAE